jgi:hypothetical protein
VTAEAELEALRRATARRKTQLHPSCVGPGLRARLADLSAALRLDIVEARAAVREAFGLVRLLPENLIPREHRLDVVGDNPRHVAHQGTEVHVYAEFENTAERLALAIGGAKTNRVAGEGFEPSTFGL